MGGARSAPARIRAADSVLARLRPPRHLADGRTDEFALGLPRLVGGGEPHRDRGRRGRLRGIAPALTARSAAQPVTRLSRRGAVTLPPRSAHGDRREPRRTPPP